MNAYPNPGDPNQSPQYPPSQGSTGMPYGAGSQMPPGAYGDQPPYQQPPYQQGAYQQQPPYQQSPYQQTPYPQQRSIVALDWRYLTAGIGAIVAFIAFFLPYYTGTGAKVGYFVSYSYSYSYSVSGAQLGGQYILDIVIAIAAIVIVLLLQFGNQIFKAPTSPFMQKLVNSLNNQKRTWDMALLILGILGIFFHFILNLSVVSSWAYGAWLYLLGMVAVAVGGFFIFRPPASTPTQVPPVR